MALARPGRHRSEHRWDRKRLHPGESVTSVDEKVQLRKDRDPLLDLAGTALTRSHFASLDDVEQRVLRSHTEFRNTRPRR